MSKDHRQFEFDLLQMDICKDSDSWITICGFGYRNLFYLEWNTRTGINQFDLLFFKIFIDKRYNSKAKSLINKF